MIESIKTILQNKIINLEITMIDIKKKKIIKINTRIINIIDNKDKIPINLGILFLGKKFEKKELSLLPQFWWFKK